VNNRLEQLGRRQIVAIAAVPSFCMAAFGLAYGAPWYFNAILTPSALMTLAIFGQYNHSGLRLKGDTLTLYKYRWRHVIDVGTIRGVRVTTWPNGEPSIWCDFDQAPPCRLPGHCFGPAEPLQYAFRQPGIAVG
jgi:hypothetical protein